VDYVYDLAGKIKQVTDPPAANGFAYDNMGRLIGTTTQYSSLPGITCFNAYAMTPLQIGVHVAAYVLHLLRHLSAQTNVTFRTFCECREISDLKRRHSRKR